MKTDTPTSSLVGCAVALAQAGFRADQVARWFGVPLVTDLALRRPVSDATRARSGVGAWIALLVGGEQMPRAALTAAPGLAAVYEALAAAGMLVERDGAARA